MRPADPPRRDVPSTRWWNEGALRVLRRFEGTPGKGVRGPRGPRGSRASLAWVDEAVAVVVDRAEAARLLTRRRDLVDECVAVTLREATWLR